ncbi:MAG: FlgD immunoglobulin-like domain containing protein, partial [Phycisphaeraceae bacterium]
MSLLLLTSLLMPPTLARAEEGAWGRHERAFVVPTPGKVTIDGKLDDWDRSPTIELYAAKATSAMQSARLSMMYDEEALYVAGEVLDNTPMMNRHDPKVDGDRAWDADACQIRIAPDRSMGWPATDNTYGDEPGTDEPLTHLLLWYYTDREEANLQIQHTMAYRKPEGWPKGVVPQDEFDGAYREHEDGAGYTFEYRIPWSTMGADNPPGEGDLVAGNLQVNWSRPDGLKTRGGAGWAYDVMSRPGFPYQTARCWGKFIFTDRNDLPRAMVEQGATPEKPLPLKFEYELPTSGEVTLGLYDQRGELVRQIAAQAAREAGSVIERWDGLNELGEPIDPGTYTWRGLVHDPIETEFVLSVHNSGQPPYKLPDNTGGWGADHSEPTTVAAAGDHMVLAWHHAEAGWGIIRTNLKGKKQWGSKHGAAHVAS